MLASLPLYASFLGTAIFLLAAALTIYVLITPHREVELIRGGNVAAALSLGGTAIGMAIVIFSTASSTYNVLELAVWSGIGLAGQLLVFGIVSTLIPGLSAGITQGRTSYGLLLAAFSIAMGILNAGALSE